MKKKVGSQYPDFLNDPIVVSDKEANPFQSLIVQKQLELKLKKLFKHFGIKHGQDIPQFPDKPPLPPDPQHCATSDADLILSNPFLDLACALAFWHVPGFVIVRESEHKKVGAPKKEKYSEKNMRGLASYIKEQASKGQTASAAIANVCKAEELGGMENPFHGTKKATLEKRWKTFKSTDIGIIDNEDYNWGRVFEIPTSEKRKQTAKKRTVKPA